jgi:glyoxylase-like metal-dependent hydrolase (beta-lactamase superfamily II)
MAAVCHGLNPGLDLGDFKIRRIHAGQYFWDGGVVFGVVPRTIWASRMPPDERNLVPLAFNCYLIETGSLTVLIETGGGHEFDAVSRDRMKLPERVPPITEYIDPLQVDMVINTHLHWDHCSGNMLNGKPAFPRARYFARRAEWDYAHTRNARDSVSYRDANYDPLVESGQMELLDSDAEVAPGIQILSAPGHNRDMCVVKATSRGRTFCHLADLVPTTEHLKPTWIAAFDLFPLTAIETKTTLLQQAAREHWWCGFGHDMQTGFATISENHRLQETLP